MAEEPLSEDPATLESKEPVPSTPAIIHIRASEGSVAGGDYNSVTAAMFVAGATLLPFLQALGTAMGTRIGERLDDTTRRALRKILRRELEGGETCGDSPTPKLLATQGGTQIQLDADMPEEALPQLLAMTFEPLEGGDTAALVRWTQTGWLATVARSGQLYDLRWDSQRSDWVGHPSSPPP